MGTPEEQPIAEDPEIKALMAKLGNKNPLPGAEVPPNQQPLNELDPEETKKAQEAEILKKGKKKGQSVTKQKAEPTVTEAETDENKELNAKYKGIISAYGDVAAETLKTLKGDRKRILRAIKTCRTVVESGGKVPKAYVEGWITALSTLSDTNGHAVKLLDSFAKFMAAGKNSEIFNNLSVNLDSATLMKLLETDKFPDEDRHGN